MLTNTKENRKTLLERLNPWGSELRSATKIKRNHTYSDKSVCICRLGQADHGGAKSKKPD